MKQGNDIDNLFRTGLEKPEIPFDDSHWAAMEERLYPKKKAVKKSVIWLGTILGFAAMLLIVFFVTMPADRKPTPRFVNKKTSQSKESEPVEHSGKETKVHSGDFKARQKLFAPVNARSGHFKLENTSGPDASVASISGPLIQSKNSLINTVALNRQPVISSPVQVVKFDTGKNVLIGFSQQKNTVVLKKTGGRPRFVLSMLAAPDLTSVASSGRSNLSGSIGAELTFLITKRLSITSGASYAKKIYGSDFNLYNPNSSYVFTSKPVFVHANCDVLDIPLNVNYKIIDGNRNSVSFSTGLSSYLMLKEKYSYTYNSAYPGPNGYEVRNQNQHYLGIANVGIALQHKLNSKLSISARPFMKIPLTPIGYGNTKLSSTGIAVSVNMNLFTK